MRVFKDDNANGIKEGTEEWANNVDIEVFNLSDDIETATPLYSGTTDANGNIAFLDGINTVNFALQGYRVVVHMPSGAYNFVTSVGDITTDTNGQQGVAFNTSNQLVNVVSAFAPQIMNISGNYWQDYETTPNGIKDAHDLLTPAGKTVKLFNVTDGVYESVTATVQADGSYTLPNVVIGPEYRVEFAYNSANEEPSILADNVVFREANNVLGYTFNSSRMAEDSTYTVNAAIVENGTINIRFSTDGTNTIGSATNLTRWLPTTYTANIGTTGNTTDHSSGTFVVPNGYRLVTSEPTDKSATIDSTNKTGNIVFLVELLEPNLSGVKTSAPSTTDLHPGDTIEYTITVTNSGTKEALDTLISDALPKDTELVSIANGGTMDSNNKITWSVPTIASDGGSTSVSFVVKVLAVKDLGRWNVVNDQAQVNGVPTNSTTNEVTQGLLSFKKMSQHAIGKELLPNDRIDYKIKVTNTGGATMSSIEVKDMIPENTTFIDGSMSIGGIMENGQFLFTIASLAPGESIEVGFSVLVNKDAKKGATIKNTAKVNGEDTNTVEHKIGTNESNVYNPSDLPQTGDSSNAIGFSGLLLLAGSTLLFLRRKEKQN